jgi:hypothetical protein
LDPLIGEEVGGIVSDKISSKFWSGVMPGPGASNFSILLHNVFKASSWPAAVNILGGGALSVILFIPVDNLLTCL